MNLFSWLVIIPLLLATVVQTVPVPTRSNRQLHPTFGISFCNETDFWKLATVNNDITLSNESISSPYLAGSQSPVISSLQKRTVKKSFYNFGQKIEE